MKLACNIDRRGRRARLITGIVVDTVGVALILAGFVQRDERMYAAGIVLMVAGSFMIFEGAAGWCALRALGFKTRI